jgi:hypothetical protein
VLADVLRGRSTSGRHAEVGVVVMAEAELGPCEVDVVDRAGFVDASGSGKDDLVAASEEGGGLGRIPGVAEEPDPPFSVLLRGCSSSAVHLELRDAYDVGDLWFRAWCDGDREEFGRRLAPRPWLDLIAEVTGRGVSVRRVRVVSRATS